MRQTTERFDRWLVMSTVFHAAVFSLVLVSPAFFPASDLKWGDPNAGGGAISIRIAGSMSGIALPTPPNVRENAVANESLGRNAPPPAPAAAPAPPPPPPPENVERIPSRDATKTKTPPVTQTPATKTPAPPAKTPSPPSKSSAAAVPPQPETPDNAIPSGQGGRPAMDYGVAASGAGPIGVGVDSIFGERYGSYVDAMRRKISQNWLQGLISPNLSSAPRVYVTFDVARDGAISNARIEQSSGITTLNNSALRAVLAASPLQPLPRDFTGSKITVSFYFEYRRQ